MNDLTVKYRPAKWSEVIGHRRTLESLQDVLDKGTSHSFIFTGPSGVGKTTIARLIAGAVQCEARNLVEIDAATHTGIDAMRAISETLNYASLGKSLAKVLIVDEAHALSKAAWQSLLKGVEEPPANVYWIFCTTEVHKIPETIKTRCVIYDLKPLHFDDVYDLIRDIADREGIGKNDKVLTLIAQYAQGSPRAALAMLAKTAACETVEDARHLLSVVDTEGGEVVDMARDIVNGKLTWARAMARVKSLEDESPEGIRLVIVAYLSSCLKSCRDDKAPVYLNWLDAFRRPYLQAEGFAPLLLSLGEIIFRPRITEI